VLNALEKLTNERELFTYFSNWLSMREHIMLSLVKEGNLSFEEQQSSERTKNYHHCTSSVLMDLLMPTRN
jgi:hypothetical protein